MGEGRVRVFQAERMLKFHQHAVHILQYVIIPESYYSIPLFSQKTGSLFIISRLFSMLTAIQFNDNFSLMA